MVEELISSAEKPKMKKFNITIVLSLFFVILFYLMLWIGGLAAFYLLMLVVLIGLTLLVLVFRELFLKRNIVASGIGIIAILIVIFKPFEFIVEALKSPVVVSGYCEHTMTSVSISLRKDKTFEYNAGAFLKKEMYYGNYNLKNDTLILNFDVPKLEKLKDTLVFKKDSIYKDEWLFEIGKTQINHLHNFKLTTNLMRKTAPAGKSG